MAQKLINRFGQEIDLTAINTEVNNATNGFTATNVQTALEELKTLLGATDLTPVTDGFDYKKTDGTLIPIRFLLIDTSTNNPKLTITVNNTLVKTIALNQNQISIDGGSDWDLTDDKLIIKDTAGATVATLDFSRYKLSIAVNTTTGATEFFQNGNLIGSISASGQNTSETFVATSNQTLFTLASAPKGSIIFFRNGIRLTSNSISVSGANVTYNPNNNGAYSLVAGDRITIDHQK